MLLRRRKKRGSEVHCCSVRVRRDRWEGDGEKKKHSYWRPYLCLSSVTERMRAQIPPFHCISILLQWRLLKDCIQIQCAAVLLASLSPCSRYIYTSPILPVIVARMAHLILSAIGITSSVPPPPPCAPRARGLQWVGC